MDSGWNSAANPPKALPVRYSSRVFGCPYTSWYVERFVLYWSVKTEVAESLGIASRTSPSRKELSMLCRLLVR